MPIDPMARIILRIEAMDRTRITRVLKLDSNFPIIEGACASSLWSFRMTRGCAPTAAATKPLPSAGARVIFLETIGYVMRTKA